MRDSNLEGGLVINMFESLRTHDERYGGDGGMTKGDDDCIDLAGGNLV